MKFILRKEKNSYSLVKRDFWDRLIITGFQATSHPDLGEDGKPVEADEKLMGAKRKAGKGRSATVMGLVVIILQYWSSNLEYRFWTIPELVMTYPLPLLFEWITNFQFLFCQWCNRDVRHFIIKNEEHGQKLKICNSCDKKVRCL